ncbi:microtubule-associated protein 1B-like [Mytilus edulis]|uniref:microtubule-associated protein 1B-like n=1 Tax=Mytilus edulis TaxID=6550 RepID=UPI0039EEFE9A
MDLTHLLPTTTFFNPTKTTSSMVNQTCNLPDSTTESPTTSQMDPLSLQQSGHNYLQQITPCQSNAMLHPHKQDSDVLDSLNSLNDREVEEFTNLISDVSVSVVVDSTQQRETLIDLPQYIESEPQQQQQYTAPNLTEQINLSTISQLIQPDLDKSEKVPEHAIGQVNACITSSEPDFSSYPPHCKCDFIDKLVAVEQIWLCRGQLYFLPQIAIVVIGNREFAGIFHNQKKGYIAVGEIIEKMMPQYESDLIGFLKRKEDVEQCTMTTQEIGYLQQRNCIGPTCRYSVAVSLNTLRQMAQFIVMYEGDKPGFDNKIKEIANGNYYKKVLQRHVRCGNCGGIILYSKEPEEYVKLNKETKIGESESKCFSVGFIKVGGFRFVAFKMDNRIYVSFKELCQNQVIKLQVLQARLGALRQRPRLAPSILNSYLNTPDYSVANTMWIDIATLRCVCCMGRCSPGFNSELYTCFATVNFSEDFVTNIFGRDDHQSDNDVYTMDPKTFEVVMKKTSMKTSSVRSKTPNLSKSKQKPTLKSFELSTKQVVGYETPEKLNESAFVFDKPMEDSLSDHNLFREKKSKSSKTPKTNKTNKDEETYVFEDKKSAISFLTKNNYLQEETIPETKLDSKKKNLKDAKYVPGKTPTFRVKPAEKPYSFDGSLKKGQNKKSDTENIKITVKDDRVMLTVATKKTPNNKKSKSKASSRRRKKEIELEDSEIISTNTTSIATPELEDSEIISTNTTSIATPEICDSDETQDAVDSLVNHFQLSPKRQGRSNVEIENIGITPRTESRILSGIDLDGSISNMFETPSSQGNVVVEMMDNSDEHPLTGSTSPLSRLYQQFEDFEKTNSPDIVPTNQTDTTYRENSHISSSETELSLQLRNETEMPINLSASKQGQILSRGDHSEWQKVSNSIGDIEETQKYSDTTIDKTVSTIRTMHSSEAQNIDPIQKFELRENVGHSTLQNLFSAHIEDKNCQSDQSEEREKRAQTFSPTKPKNGSCQNSPISKLKKTSSSNSPVFKKSGEIDMNHAKVKKLSELGDHPLDLLASLAEVITDETENEQTMAGNEDADASTDQQNDETLKYEEVDQSKIDKSIPENEFTYFDPVPDLYESKEHIELCTFADENSNIDKVTLSTKAENTFTSEFSNEESRDRICKFLDEVESHMTIEPYKDTSTGYWKVRIRLKPDAKETYPGLFGSETDKKKRNMIFAFLGKLHLPENIPNSERNSEQIDNLSEQSIKSFKTTETSLGHPQSNSKTKLKSSRSNKAKKSKHSKKSGNKSSHNSQKNNLALQLFGAGRSDNNSPDKKKHLEQFIPSVNKESSGRNESITSPNTQSVMKRARQSPLEYNKSKKLKSH